MKAFSLLFSSIVFSYSMAHAEWQAWTGAVSGGGGKGVICRDSSGAVTSAELLDLWEGQNLYKETPKKLTGNLSADVSTLIDSLRNAYDYQGGGTIATNGPVYQGQDYILARLRQQAHLFTSNDPSINWLHVALSPTDDSYEVVQPQPPCHIEQIVNYQIGGQILIFQDLYDRLDEASQVALILHESFYSILRDIAHETTSLRVRRAVAYVMAGGTFSANTMPFPTKFLSCVSSEQPYALNNLILSLDPGKPGFQILPQEIDGSSLMGLSSWSFAAPLATSVSAPGDILAASCSGNVPSATWKFDLSGPVEFDRTLAFITDCATTPPTVFLQATKIGTGETEQSSLNCIALPEEILNIALSPTTPDVIAAGFTTTATEGGVTTTTTVQGPWALVKMDVANTSDTEVTISNIEFSGTGVDTKGKPVTFDITFDSSQVIPPLPSTKNFLLDLQAHTASTSLEAYLQALPCNVNSYDFSVTATLMGWQGSPTAKGPHFQQTFNFQTTGIAGGSCPTAN